MNWRIRGMSARSVCVGFRMWKGKKHLPSGVARRMVGWLAIVSVSRNGEERKRQSKDPEG